MCAARQADNQTYLYRRAVAAELRRGVFLLANFQASGKSIVRIPRLAFTSKEAGIAFISLLAICSWLRRRRRSRGQQTG